MEVEIPKGKEVFIQGKDIKFKAYSPSTTPQYYYPKKMTTYKKRILDNQYKSWNKPSNVVITGQLGKKIYSGPHCIRCNNICFLSINLCTPAFISGITLILVVVVLIFNKIKKRESK